MTAPTNDQIAALGAALETFSRRYKLTDTGGGARPLAEVDRQTLFFIKKHPDCGPTDVARFLGVAMTTMSSATDRLAKRGLLERHRPEDDRRAVALRLSETGKKYVSTQEQAYHDMFLLMLNRLSVDERGAFITMIQKIAFTED
ncbi:MAG: MarR family winged helix-turn-helix transcriptional regulator [Phyllobacterium sp.]